MSQIEQRAVGIVNDDQAVRDSLRFLLEVVGHPVETFASAAEFLAAGPRDLACLILDHHMPQMTACNWLKSCMLTDRVSLFYWSRACPHQP